MKKIATLVETTRDRAATVKSGSTVFSVPQQQRAVSAAEEFCFNVKPRLGVKDATWNERVEAGNLLRVLMKPNKNTVFK